MIIACNNCNKKFSIDKSLIPDTGRLLQCNSCNHKWFFQHEILIKNTEITINENLKIFEDKKPQARKLKDVDNKAISNNKIITPTEKIVATEKQKKIKILKKKNSLNLITVFIISFVALILLIDTFKYPLSKIVPNLEILLYNLYESIKDIELFIKDLI